MHFTLFYSKMHLYILVCCDIGCTMWYLRLLQLTVIYTWCNFKPDSPAVGTKQYNSNKKQEDVQVCNLYLLSSDQVLHDAESQSGVQIN